MNVLETEGLTRRFGNLIAVDALTISVETGEVFALLGANGAGKTVTMKMLTTLLPPSAGNARVAVARGVFTRTHAIPTGGLPYLDFMAPGILVQSVLFIAIFYEIAVIWERDLGVVHKLFVSPTPRAALVLGKAVSAGVRGLSQAVIIYLLAWLLGVRINWHPLALIGVLVVVVLGAACFSTLSLIIAALVKTRERFMGIGEVLTMPLFFASNAIYPVSIMPSWLRACAAVNPLTYEVEALRVLMLPAGPTVHRLAVDLGVLVVTLTGLVMLGAILYPRIAN